MSAGSVLASSDYSESLGNNLAGMGSFLMDPSAAARRIYSRWFWLGPLLLSIVITAAASWIISPIVQHVLMSQPVPPNVNPEAYQAQLAMGMRAQRYIAFFAPLFTLLFQALLLWGMSSMVAVETRFRQMLNLAAGCSLISTLAGIATFVVLRAKGEISTMAELRPPMGLDIFLPEGANKVLLALTGYFSIFEIWWIVMLVLTFSAAYRVSKGKALTVIAPLVLISIILRVVIALFQR